MYANFALVVCAGLSACLYSYLNWTKAIKGTDAHETDRAFKRAYPLLRTNGRFLASFAEWEHQNGRDKEAWKLMHAAEGYFCDIAFLHNLAMTYEEEGKVEEAGRKLELAIYLSPNNTRIRYAQIQFLQRHGKKQEAREARRALWRDLEKRKGKMSSQDQYITRQLGTFSENE